MKNYKLLILGVTLFGPSLAWAGDHVSRVAPTLGEGGMVALGLGLVGAGVAFLRRR